jgi:mannitol-1-phosphate 5-dehydrogenase
MLDVHFGAGNIGRGFIGETLADNGFKITFVDVNDTLIDELNKRNGYTIELAAEGQEHIEVHDVKGINNGKDPKAVAEEIAQADMVTTAIGPKISEVHRAIDCRRVKVTASQQQHDANRHHCV